MSVLKNNGVNLGNGNPTSIADGDVKIDGGSLFVRNGGAWSEVGGGGGNIATGVISAGDKNVTLTASWSFAGTWSVILVPHRSRVYSGNGTSLSFTNGSWSDSTNTLWIWCAAG